MQKLTTLLLAVICILAAPAAYAQYVFPTTLAPYRQSFNAMGNDTTVTFNTNGTASNVSLPGIVAGYKAGAALFGASPSAAPNDGGTVTNTAYNFGSSTSDDRALGGMAGSLVANTNTTGYVAVRLQSATNNPTIRNLDVRYAIEQWYNSAQASQAYVQASYRVYAAGATFSPNDLVQDDGVNGWTAVPALKQQAPATGGLVGKANGNSTTYRRTAQARLLDVNLAPGMEVVIRFYYFFNTSTNGNGISVDDIAVFPETNVLYSSTIGLLNNTSNGSDRTWSTTVEGNIGTASAVDFGAANTTYYVLGNNSASRLGSSGWNVTGTNSRVIVGTDNSSATLLLASGDAMQGTVEVNKNSTLQIADPLTGTNLSSLKLGQLATGSLVEYLSNANQRVLVANYAKLNLGGTAGIKAQNSGHVTVSEALTLSRPVTIQGYNLVLLGAATLTRNSGGQVVATNNGTFQRVVPGKAASSLLFPMALGSATSDYLPLTITSGSSDLDDNYRVQLIDGVYKTYSGNAGTTSSATMDDLAMTWFASHETTTPVAATLQVGWVGGNSREGSRLAVRRSQAYLDHYSSGTNAWDASPANRGATSADGLWNVTRTGVSSFSPFAITANDAGPLPVQLARFEASRAAATVLCSWTTASELNNSYFVVERSLDGATFEALGRVAGQGSSATAHRYTFVDARPAAGLAYYRLQQVDTDGTASYSAVVAVAGEAGTRAAVLASPNPGPGRFELQTAFGVAGEVQATVLDMLGQPVLRARYPVPAGTATLPLDLSAQPAGVYLVRLQGPAGTATVRLLKQ